jgi:hypothetical protein
MATDHLEQVRAWLRVRNPDAGEIDLDLDLIDSGLVSSLAFPEFLIFLESLVGREIPLRPETAVSFRTLRGIRDAVLAGATGA